MKKDPTKARNSIEPTREIFDINHISKLANLQLTNAERKMFLSQLTNVLNYFEKLRKLNTDKVEPIGHITGLENVGRRDVTAPSISQEDALKNAPKVYRGFFEVEAIFEEQNE